MNIKTKEDKTLQNKTPKIKPAGKNFYGINSDPRPMLAFVLKTEANQWQVEVFTRRNNTIRAREVEWRELL